MLLSVCYRRFKMLSYFNPSHPPPPHLHMQNPTYLSRSTSSLCVAGNLPIQAEGGGAGPNETTAKKCGPLPILYSLYAKIAVIFIICFSISILDKLIFLTFQQST